MKETLSQVKKLEKETKKHNKLMDELQVAVETTHSEFTSFERKDIKLREDLKHNKQKLKTAAKAIAAAQKTQTTSNTSVEKNSRDVEARKSEMEAHEATLVDEQQKLDAIALSLKGETAAVQKDIDAQQKVSVSVGLLKECGGEREGEKNMIHKCLLDCTHG